MESYQLKKEILRYLTKMDQEINCVDKVSQNRLQLFLFDHFYSKAEQLVHQIRSAFTF